MKNIKTGSIPLHPFYYYRLLPYILYYIIIKKINILIIPLYNKKIYTTIYYKYNK